MPGVKLLVRSAGEEAVAESKGPKVAVKIDPDVVRIAGILAAAEGTNLADWLSQHLRESLAEPYEEFLAKERAKGRDTSTESGTTPSRRKPSGG